MKIKAVHITGFRNYKNVTIPFSDKTLVIGANDVGKTNLIYALRLLLDRTLSDAELEPSESDFYAYEDTDNLSIVIEFVEVTDDCVVAKMRGLIGDDGGMCIAYQAHKDPTARRATYELLAGYDPEHLSAIPSRHYLRVLNLKFIGSRRDLFAYIRNERRKLLFDAKGLRSEAEIASDTALLTQIETDLASVSGTVTKLSYVSKATDSLNTELGELSFHNLGQQVMFDTGASDPSEFVDNLKLVSRVNDRSLVIGGDGRNNQIHLALWAARNRVNTDEGTDLEEITFFCIEEPEAHLHPHQQRRLARYLADILSAQVIITTHSPQITCEFPPHSIIRLYSAPPNTLAAGHGINPLVEGRLIDFGYRLNAISAEVFFSSVVLLVEGFSEEIFYKALSRQIEDMDLDRLNISIQVVGGVGFTVYASLLHSLNIPFVIRTDNDVFTVPRKRTKRFAGVHRAIKLYQNFREKNDEIEEVIALIPSLEFDDDPPHGTIQAIERFRSALEEVGIFLADIDLEYDVFDDLSDELRAFFKGLADEEIIAEMKQQKATAMFAFLRQNSSALKALADSALAKPLLRCKAIVEGN